MAKNVVVPPFPVAPETVVGSTPRSVFDFDFPFWEKADILVFINGLKLASANYSVQGLSVQNGTPVEGGYGSGRITLNTPVSNCKVKIDRRVKASRETAFARSSPLSMPALNADLNKLTARQQDYERMLRDVEKGVVDPDMLAEVVDDATAGKADSDAANVAGANALAWPERILRRRTDVGALPITAAAMLDRIPRAPIDFGAEGIESVEVLVDETAALQAMVDGAYNSGAVLPGLPGGGIIEVDRTYYINAPLYLRSFVELRGTSRAGILSDHDGATNTNPGFSRWANGSLKGTIICGPYGKIVPKDSCKIRYMNIVSSAAATIPPNGNAAGLKAYVNGFNAHPIAIEGAYGGADIVIEDCFVVGFQLAFKMVYTERFDIRFCRVDCINGLYSQDIYDDSRYVYNHHWPFAIAHRIDASDPAAAQISREYGTAINFGKNPASDRSIDAGHVVGNMIYGYSVAIRLQDTNGLHCLDNWIDGPKGRSDINTTVGLVIEGNCRRTKILGNHFDSLGVLIDLKGSGCIFDNNTLSGWADRAIRTWDGTANHFGFTMIQDGAASDGSIDFMNGAATVRFDSLWFSVGRGAAVNVPTDPAKRLGVSFGEVRSTTPAAGFTPIDPEQWRTSVEVARSGGPQSLTASAYTKIVFDQTLSDGLSEWNGAQATFTARKAGLYRVELVFGLQPGTTAGGALAVEFRKNGGALDAYRWQTFEQGHTGIVQNGISRTIGLAAGDTLAFYAYTDTGGSVVSGKTALRIRPA